MRSAFQEVTHGQSVRPSLTPLLRSAQVYLILGGRLGTLKSRATVTGMKDLMSGKRKKTFESQQNELEGAQMPLIEQLVTRS